MRRTPRAPPNLFGHTLSRPVGYPLAGGIGISAVFFVIDPQHSPLSASITFPFSWAHDPAWLSSAKNYDS